jgi:hypothetical protein
MTLVPDLRASDRLAALPMYDLPDLRTANDTLWHAPRAWPMPGLMLCHRS